MKWKMVSLLSYHMHFNRWLRDQDDYIKTTNFLPKIFQNDDALQGFPSNYRTQSSPRNS